MPYHPTNFGTFVIEKPDEATEKILRTFRAEGANAVLTAESLGISTRNFHRYVESLGIKRQIDAMRRRARKEGWLKSGRWPGKKAS
jgi:hypothetical protein